MGLIIGVTVLTFSVLFLLNINFRTEKEGLLQRSWKELFLLQLSSLEYLRFGSSYRGGRWIVSHLK